MKFKMPLEFIERSEYAIGNPMRFGQLPQQKYRLRHSTKWNDDERAARHDS